MTNHQMVSFSGSETFLLTMAERLIGRDHRVTVYSKFIEPLTGILRSVGAEVCDSLDALSSETFDLAHVHHNIGAYEVRAAFPQIPMVFISHGVLPFLEQPPAADLGIAAYLAVSEEVRDRLLSRGVPSGKVRIFRNMVDEDRFRPTGPISPVPRRAVVLSNKIDTATEDLILAACDRLGIRCLFFGNRFLPADYRDLPAIMNEADLVFSLGRGAMEAMLCGRIPFILDYQGSDGLVTPGNLHETMKCNLSGRRFAMRHDVDGLVRELERYRPEYGDELLELATGLFGAGARIEELETIYRGILDRHETIVPDDIAQSITDTVVGTVRETVAYTNILRDHRDEQVLAESRTREGRCRVAERLLDAGWIEAARSLLVAVLEESLDNSLALTLMARLGVMEGNYREALEILKYVLSQNPDDDDAARIFTLLRYELVTGESTSETADLAREVDALEEAVGYRGENLVFIVGPPRSGTTWVLSLLKEHPDVVAATVDNLGIRENDRTTTETGIFSGDRDLSDEQIRERFHAVTRRHPGKTIVEKTPNHLFHISRILTIFPRARIVLTCRDGRDVVASIVQVGRDPGAWWKDAPDSVEEATRLWKRFAEAAVECEKTCSPHVLRYEALLSQTGQEVTGLNRALGLSPDHVDRQIESSHRGKNIPIRGVYSKGIAGGWKSVFTEEDERTFLEIAGPVLGTAGDGEPSVYRA